MDVRLALQALPAACSLGNLEEAYRQSDCPVEGAFPALVRAWDLPVVEPQDFVQELAEHRNPFQEEGRLVCSSVVLVSKEIRVSAREVADAAVHRLAVAGVVRQVSAAAAAARRAFCLP